MTANYGINVQVKAIAPRDLKINSTTPVAIVGTVKPGEGHSGSLTALFKVFNNAETALEYLITEKLDGTLRDNLPLLISQNVQCQVVLSGSVHQDKASDQTTKVGAAVDKLKQAEKLLQVKPNLVLAPGFSTTAAIATKLIAVAEKLKGHALVDVEGANEAVVKTVADAQSSRRVVLCHPEVLVSQDADGGNKKYLPLSTALAGVMAKTDGEVQFGWAYSPSNRAVQGILDTKRNIEFLAGEDCEADRLRGLGVTTVIHQQGFRTWGAATKDTDPAWQDLVRVRVFDRLAETCLKKLQWCVDKNASSKLLLVRTSVTELFNRLKGAGVLLGFEVAWDTSKNTETNLAAGKFYLTAKLQNTPQIQRLQIDLTYSSEWSSELIAA